MSIVSRFVSLVIAVSGKEWLLPTKHTFALWLLLFRLFFAAATTIFWASPAAALLLSVRCAMVISGGKNLPTPRTRGLWASTSSAQISNEIIRIDDSVFDRATKHTFSVIG